MKTGKLSRHLLFWTLYFTITLFNELYLSESFSIHPTFQMFFECFFACILLLTIKLFVAYVFMYRLIPKWIKSPGKTSLYLQGLLIVLVGAVLIRLCMHFIIWPFIYEDKIIFTPIRLLARYFYSLLDLLQVVGIASAIKLYNLRMEARVRENELIREKLTTEILHLKSQINPHFLFNTLNSVYALALTGSKLTADALMRLSKILRYILYETQVKAVSLISEVKLLEDYISLQQLRFSGRIKVQVNTKINNPNASITPLLLLPLIENAYKHSNDIEASIEINITEENNHLHFISKNTVAEESIRHEQYGGIGLKNIERQLELLYSNYSIKYATESNLFILNLFIDLNSNANIELPDN